MVQIFEEAFAIFLKVLAIDFSDSLSIKLEIDRIIDQKACFNVNVKNITLPKLQPFSANVTQVFTF